MNNTNFNSNYNNNKNIISTYIKIIKTKRRNYSKEKAKKKAVNLFFIYMNIEYLLIYLPLLNKSFYCLISFFDKYILLNHFLQLENNYMNIFHF